ncbi:uracil/xanthine transporter [Alicyclobacillus dauci]|uniref:Uracil/xanthine transporter n=1 Tax=Alicyclobacillus dauci TaxID=1475485 RepID=A0ABY6Z376_9BACL|nr:uracil/xanthine transporter [Alicyclobacillus dauci]WAH37209.1 uracil/xanthine transporter [Alicyclobacillus dauci]
MRISHQTSTNAFFHSFAGLQWLSFMFANTVVIPLSVGAVLHLSPEVIAGMMSRSFMLTGLACLIQVLLGHRLPLMEGQSGIWWGSILSLVTVFTSSGLSLGAIGGGMELAVLVTGVFVVLFGVLGLDRILTRIFNSMVMTVLLFLLSAQLIHIFFLGMMGIGGTHTQIQPGTAAVSIGIVVIVMLITIFGRGVLGNFSILIGMIVGWIAFALLFGGQPADAPSLASMIQTFSWGTPRYSTGILVSMVVIGIINSTNTIATLRAAEPVFDEEIGSPSYRRSFMVTGIFTILSGLFSVVPYAPYTSSIGFLRTTRIIQRLPFIIGALMFILLGAIPQLVGFFSTMPISVGDAVLFVAYLQLFGSALHNIEGVQFNFRTIFRVALPTLAGLAVLSTPSQAFTTLPGIMQPICSNGMLVGIMLSVILEFAIKWRGLDG